VGRFLEHSRIYHFHNGGDEEVYLGSADMMERNLDRRVEILFPVEDPRHRAQIVQQILPAYLRDTANAQTLNPDGTYQPVESQTSATEAFDVHRWLVEFYRR
jgi:polyphosphate kinase